METFRLVQTAKDTIDRLAVKASEHLEYEKGEGVTLSLRPERTYQKVLGFGGAFTEAAAYTFYRMNPAAREQIVEKYFDPDKGIGYTIGRVHMNSCDFALGNYSYVKKNDTGLATFNISHEDQWTIPMIKEAEAERKGKIILLASPWSPPEWMKTNGEMNNGGKLLPEHMETWAKYYARYIKAMRARGLSLWAITVQNEPAAVQTWDSCIYSAEEEGRFVSEFLGPVLEDEGLSDVKIYIWDHNRDLVVERATGTLSVPGASKYVYGIANHWYVSEEFENLSKVHELYPDKHILFSEGCVEGGVKPDSWYVGERYGRNMIGDFNNWQEGWLDWNLILDETGGPNHVGNFCDAPIIADTVNQELIINMSYYYIGHFSRFVKPGAVRIGVDAEKDTPLQHVAFVNKGGGIVLIAMNETEDDIGLNAELGGKYARHTIPAHSIVTVIFDK